MKSRTWLISLLGSFLLANSSFGFIVLNNEVGKKSVLVSLKGKIVIQPCGTKAISLAELKLVTVEVLLSKCKEESVQAAQYPLSPNETDFILSVQSLYGILGTENSADALVKLTNKVLSEEGENGEDTDDGSVEQRQVLTRLRRAHGDILANLGSESHKSISFANDRPLFHLIYEGLRLVYFDGDRFWSISEKVQAEAIDSACSVGWAPASADLILNSPHFTEVGRWFGKQSDQIISWYQWQEFRPVDKFEGYEPNSWKVVIIPNQKAVEWDLNHAEPVAPTGSVLKKAPHLPGIGTFVYVAGSTDKYSRHVLCTRTYRLEPNSVAPPVGEISIEGLSAEVGYPWPVVTRLLAPHRALEERLSQHSYWSTPLAQPDAEEVKRLVRSQLGVDKPTVPEARSQASHFAKEEIHQIGVRLTRLLTTERRLREELRQQHRTLQIVSGQGNRASEANEISLEIKKLEESQKQNNIELQTARTRTDELKKLLIP